MWILPISCLVRLHCRTLAPVLVKPAASTGTRSIIRRNMSGTVRPKVYVTRRVPPKGLELLRPVCDLTQWDSDDPVPQSELLKNVPGIDALFCLLTDKIDNNVIEAAGSNLKVIGTMSVGYDHVDLETCKKKNIPVGYTPDVLTDATAELTVSLLLTTARRLPEGVNAVRTGLWGTWAPLWMCGATLQGSTVGIVGLGRIGMATAKRILPFGVNKLLYTGRTERSEASQVQGEFVDMDTLLNNSDFVIATCALTKYTQGMFNKEAFSKMKKSAVFINTSRGGVVNQKDLYDALSTGQIGAAGLEVTTPEPLPIDDPLLTLDNCVILPHIGSATFDTRNAMSELCARNILAVLNGESMPAQVNI